MKKVFFLIFVIYGISIFAQKSKKPEYIIIANNKIISKEKLSELVKQGLVKRMNKGVTEGERNKLAKNLGDKIGDKEFIIKIDLFKEKEQQFYRQE